MSRRTTIPLLLLWALVLGCATGHRGRATDQIIGVLVLSGTDQPIIGAEISLVAVEPLGPRADPADAAGELRASLSTGALGSFLFTTLGPPEAPQPLLRDWLYELSGTAPGFYSVNERVRFEGGQLALTIEIDVIDDTAMEGSQFVGEQRPDRLQDVDGTLIDEVLRRQGRQPPPGF